MSKLILIKHASPEVVSDVPSHRWRLSKRGRAQAAALAERLRVHAPEVIVTSEEPKAAETGQILADALGLSAGTAPKLHEHDPTNVPLMRTPEFISAMALFFNRPDELVLGRETARAARQRITDAIDRLLNAHLGKNLAIVTHGTVLALFAARAAGMDEFQLWRRMALPSFVVLTPPEMTRVELVERV
jgi:2,3-bisphosphoglycerate-dependent phosphoglycerate mutase